MADALMAAKTTLANPSMASVFMMKPVNDPVFQALRSANEQVTTQFVPFVDSMIQIGPADDTQAYPAEGSPQVRLCRPFLRVQELGPPLPSPAVRFERQEDGLHLKVTLEEDPTKRLAGAVPFNVTARAVQLKFGKAPDQLLNFDTPLQESLPPTDPPGPAFRIVAEAKVPDERVEVLVQAMKTADEATWNIMMEFPWVWGSWMPGPDLIGSLPGGPHIPQSGSLVRVLPAHYPLETGRNRPIFAVVSNDYAQVPWSNSPAGYYLPTPIPDTVYCVPDAYRLQVDPVTGRPAIEMTLLKGETDDDPKNYTIRCTLRVQPDFDPVRLDRLRTLVRRQLQIEFADLTLGGYKAASFQADEALAGIGELFAGQSAADKSLIDAINGFSLTYEGRAEFIDALLERLQSTGIGGQVTLQLDQPGDELLALPIPVALTVRQLAAVALPGQFQPVAVNGQPEPGLPRTFTLRNPTPLPMQVAAIQSHALQKLPLIGAVKAWCDATATGAPLPAVLAPNGSLEVVFTLSKPEAVYNAWSIQLIGTTPAPSEQVLLDLLLDHATQGVRGWQITLDCPPLQFFEQLTPAQQAPFQDVVAVEVEVKRKLVQADTGTLLDTPSETVRLTKQAPAGDVLLSRTVADFVSDRAPGRNVFLYRRRLVRILHADEWGPWQEATGSATSVFFN